MAAQSKWSQQQQQNLSRLHHCVCVCVCVCVCGPAPAARQLLYSDIGLQSWRPAQFTPPFVRQQQWQVNHYGRRHHRKWGYKFPHFQKVGGTMGYKCAIQRDTDKCIGLFCVKLESRMKQNVTENVFWMHCFMAALCNRAGHKLYIFILWFLLSLFLSFFPRINSTVGDWVSTIFPYMMWP